MLRKQSSRFLTCLYICCYVSAGLELSPNTDFEKGYLLSYLDTYRPSFLPIFLEGCITIPTYLSRKQSSRLLTCLFIRCQLVPACT